LIKKTINIRLMLVCIFAASVGLPIALLGIAKTLLLVGGSIILLFAKPLTANAPANRLARTSAIVLLTIAAFAASILWTTGTPTEAFGSLVKYGKLLIIPVIVLMLRNRTEAIVALAFFMTVQLFLVVSSWMLFAHLPVPWAIAHTALSHNVVFSSYLDEGLMAAVFAGLCWHLRGLVPGRFGSYCAVGAALLALGTVFFVFEGRSGHVVAIALLTLAILWALPRKYRLGIVLVPFLLMIGLYAASSKVQNRVDLVKKEVQTFSFKKGESVDSTSSSGIRLHFWHRAVQSIAEKPLLGSGAGSWSSEFNRLERLQNPAHRDIQPQGNPHQEFLLWGVQLGVPGILLLVALMISIFKDALTMDQMAARAVQSVLLALAIACLFNATLYDALIGDFFCAALGLLLALGTSKQNHAAVSSATPVAAT
jgi:O-antigen ligase